MKSNLKETLKSNEKKIVSHFKDWNGSFFSKLSQNTLCKFVISLKSTKFVFAILGKDKDLLLWLFKDHTQDE